MWVIENIGMQQDDLFVTGHNACYVYVPVSMDISTLVMYNFSGKDKVHG